MISRIQPAIVPKQNPKNVQNRTSFQKSTNQLSFQGAWMPTDRVLNVVKWVTLGTEGDHYYNRTESTECQQYHPYSWETSPDVRGNIENTKIKQLSNDIKSYGKDYHTGEGMLFGPPSEKFITNDVSIRSNHPDFVQPPKNEIILPEIGNRMTREDSLYDQSNKLLPVINYKVHNYNDFITEGKPKDFLSQFYDTQKNKDYDKSLKQQLQSISDIKEKRNWIKAEADTLHAESLKGALVDISTAESENDLYPIKNFLVNAKKGEFGTNLQWVEGKLIATPYKTQKVADFILESFGMVGKEVTSLSAPLKKSLIENCMNKDGLTETVMKYAKQVIKR